MAMAGGNSIAWNLDRRQWLQQHVFQSIRHLASG